MKEKVFFENTDSLFIGDVGYALDDEIYSGIWGGEMHWEDGVIRTQDNDVAAVAGHTFIGDGFYMANRGYYGFAVDSGSIGVTNLKYEIKDNFNILETLGKVITLPNRRAKCEFSDVDGLFKIKITDPKSRKVLFNSTIDTHYMYVNKGSF